MSNWTKLLREFREVPRGNTVVEESLIAQVEALKEKLEEAKNQIASLRAENADLVKRQRDRDANQRDVNLHRIRLARLQEVIDKGKYNDPNVADALKCAHDLFRNWVPGGTPGYRHYATSDVCPFARWGYI